MDEDEPITRKQREPITMVFAVILLAAMLIAVGIHINDNILHKTTPTVDDKSTVVVDYTGSFYNYYNDGGAMFQTSVKSIEDDPNYVHAISYSAGTQLTVDMSGSSYLEKFQNALLGHHAGDKVRVAIDAADGYYQPDTNMMYVAKVPACITSETAKVEIYDSLGWTYTSTALSSGLYSIVLNMSYNDECESTSDTFGTVKTTHFEFKKDVKDGMMYFDITIEGAKAVNDTKGNPEYIPYGGEKYRAVQMIELPFANPDGGISTVHVVAVDDVQKPTDIVVKTQDERYNIDLYFEITVISITNN